MDETRGPGPEPAGTRPEEPAATRPAESAGSPMVKAAKALGCLVLAALVFFIALIIGVFDLIL